MINRKHSLMLMPKKLNFLTNCIGSDGPSINKMKDLAKEITFDMFRRRVSMKEIYSVIPCYRRDFPIKNDWAVGYFSSFYRGKPCYYLVWSAIEYIFV